MLATTKRWLPALITLVTSSKVTRMNYSHKVAAILAREINKNTRKHFGTLHADAIEELSMTKSPCSCTSSMDVNRGPNHEKYRTIVNTPSPASVEAQGQKQAGAPSTDSINSGMACKSPVPLPIAPRVDQKNLRTGEDSRATYGAVADASLAAAASNGGPRRPMRGQKNSRYSGENHPTFQATDQAKEIGD